MKKLFEYIFAILLLASFQLFISCDEIDPPYTETVQIDTTSKGDTLRKILLEDYTGFKCVFCPTATDLAVKFKDTIYPGRIILMAVHAGSFADTDKVHTYNFKTPESIALDNFFGNSKKGNPNGMINRIGYPDNVVLKTGEWDKNLQTVLATKAKMSLKLSASIESGSSTINIKTDIKYNTEGTSSDYLCVYILEDSIVNYQADIRFSPPDRKTYVHNHVLRGSVTGTWGEQLSTSNITKGQAFTKSYNYAIPSGKDWRKNKLKIVAFIHDFAKSYEIWQAEETDVVLK